MDEKHNVGNKHFLLTYNREDCQALQLLTEELSKIKHSARTLSEIDFADQPKLQATGIGGEIHSQFEEMLKFAHANYDKTKINFQLCNKRNEDSENVLKYEKGRQGQREKRSKITKTIQLHSVEACPKCGRKSLQSTEQVSKRLITDFVLTKGGIKKATIQYLGPNKYCTKCHKQFPPPTISKYRANQVFGEGVMAWFVYHRVALRLPYKVINQLALEQFSEKITLNNGLGFIRKSAQYYIETEKLIILKLLTSPFIHVDETPISIKGFQWYVWVFTDGKYVIFRLSETREAVIVRDFLANYEGILISDFYPGYDSLHCPQQKCWVHLIRDINYDLWTNPFDVEYEIFVQEVRNLIIPIMETVQRYGLKKRHFNKFSKSVHNFYKKVIVDKRYKSDITKKYQHRFIRYRDNLFTFLEQDGILGIIIQRKERLDILLNSEKYQEALIEIATHLYLVLLGIRQSCRFQDKSFYKFLFSERDRP